VLINDPLVLKLADDLYWLSIADSDIWLWARTIAAERNIEAEVSKPDASPMAMQGPKAEDVIASIFGEWVRELKHFWFRECEIDGIPTVVARSGWSKQGGFEI
jgi:glycine cleavage system aminomethyltransferase T